VNRRVESAQEFFRRGNKNHIEHRGRKGDDDDDDFTFPGKSAVRGALARSLSAAATSSPHQVRTAEIMNSGKKSGKGRTGREERRREEWT